MAMAMATSIFDDKASPPVDDAVRAVLGAAAPLWSELRAAIAEAHAPLDSEWVWGGKPYGWSLRLRQKKRAVLYLTPCSGYFRAAFAIGGKAADAAPAARLARHVLRAIADAPRFAEGRAVRLEVRSAADVADVVAVAALKMSH
jgi:hypothetical protein